MQDFSEFIQEKFSSLIFSRPSFRQPLRLLPQRLPHRLWWKVPLASSEEEFPLRCPAGEACCKVHRSFCRKPLTWRSFPEFLLYWPYSPLISWERFYGNLWIPLPHRGLSRILNRKDSMHREEIYNDWTICIRLNWEKLWLLKYEFYN